MKIKVILLSHLLLCLSCINYIASRPPSPITYFPSYHHPWSKDDSSEHHNYRTIDDPAKNEISEFSSPNTEYKPRFPVYSSMEDGFVPSDLTALDKVFWWKKRFHNYKTGPVEDIPFYDDTGINKSVDDYLSSNVYKRDYTAAQLVNMLKALAKARRQRNIRVAGKGLRFGISK